MDSQKPNTIKSMPRKTRRNPGFWRIIKKNPKFNRKGRKTDPLFPQQVSSVGLTNNQLIENNKIKKRLFGEILRLEFF